MIAKLHYDGVEHAAAPPFDGADHAIIYDLDDCPLCHCKTLKVRGLGIRERGHDTYTADAQTICCGKPIGKLVVTVDTLFGIEEDERVLHGRCRVY